MSEQLILKAPVSGATVAIEDVPDPVFASKMVGDGLSIDPTSPFLLAPCSGKVLQIHPSCHALTIKNPKGPEILMHIGLDTVGLKGEGFKPLVSQGDEVVAGDRLLEFDADLIACKSKSLLTEILVTNTELVEALEVHHGQAVAGETNILTITLREDFSTAQDKKTSSEQYVYSPPIVVRNPQGLHARPAANLVNSAKRFKSDIELLRGSQSANCKSVVAIMALQVDCGDTVKLQASGPDQDEAIKELTRDLRNGLGETLAAIAVQEAADEEPSANDAPIIDGVYKGIPASPGLALGQVFQIKHHEWVIPEKGGTPTQERQLLDRVIGQAQSELEKLEQQLAKDASKDKAAIFAAHRELLNDPDLVDNAQKKILQGHSAAFAWKEAFTSQAERLSALKQKMLAARATDVRDVGERVLRLLLGKEAEVPEMPENTIIIAEELTPSDTASLDRSKVLGFATVLGGGTSHAAILARSLDLPAIAGINPKALELKNGLQVLLNGDKGTLDTDISEAEMTDIRQQLEKQKELKRLYHEQAGQPAITKDGHRVAVLANIGSIDDAKKAMSLGAEGVGLLRSEFLFMNRPTPPGEDEQAHIYRAIALAVGKNNPLIIRTLDVGGDKPLPYLPVPKEDNPFLGERGLRLCLNRPEILRTQFRAILRAAELAKVMVMLPMVTSVQEFRQAKEIFQHEQQELGVADVPLGIMIEVPSAALTACVMGQDAEFFSIGTNDLTQYTLAIDRGHPKLASQADGLHPAVLRLIHMTVEGGHAHRRQVGICGGLGGELAAVPILIGLGIDELSVAAPAIGAVKYTIRQLSYQDCRALADKALGCENAAKVREMLEAQK
ncbi:phosphoenolpyruvate--protein phosphotransferase [bacterium]|nr:phosphoenolpyruvate--protein phosphotransferase [bacterium]